MHISFILGYRKERSKHKDEKGQRDRRLKKPGAEKEDAANSIKKQEEAEVNVENPPSAEQRGLTIPRNTGQRYSSAVAKHGAVPKHISFSPHN